MVLGTPGADQQVLLTMQTLLNMVDFGMAISPLNRASPMPCANNCSLAATNCASPAHGQTDRWRQS